MFRNHTVAERTRWPEGFVEGQDKGSEVRQQEGILNGECVLKLHEMLRYGLRYGRSPHIECRMKTTIDLDEDKLRRVMQLTGVKTRREAVDQALTEAERIAKIRRMLSREWTEEEMKDAFAPNYDVLKIREQEKGHHGGDSR